MKTISSHLKETILRDGHVVGPDIKPFDLCPSPERPRGLDCLPRRDIRPRSLDRRLDRGAISAGPGPRPGGEDDIGSVPPTLGAFVLSLVPPSRLGGWLVYECVGSARAAANPNNSPPRWK